ncbi:MAG TPA: tetratricopeptide repeat protein [Treponemataceae bacterium]|nr:tetratricopeptide repeat protein [Treponemataceae bacterium]
MKKNKVCIRFCVFLLISFFSACTTTQKIEKGEGIVDGHEVAVESEEEIFSLSDFLDTLYVSLRNNGLEKTLGLFDTLPEEAEGDFTIEYLHASLLFSANDYDAAAEIANRLAVENPNNADVMYLRAMIAKGQGKLTEKNALLKQMIAEDPTNPEANVELANDQMLRKNFGLAKRYFQTSLSSDPTNPDAMLGLGQSAYYTGDLKMSKDILTRMTEIYPEESMGWFFLAKLAGEEENYKKAGDYIETALSIEPDYYDYWSDYGIYLRYQGRSDEAEKAWSRAIDLNDEAFYAYIHRASLYDEKEDLDKALLDYIKIIELNPDYPYSYESLGMIYWHKEEWAKSRNAFNYAYKLNPANISYPLMISATYLREKNTKANKDFLKNVYGKFPADSIEYAMTRLYYDGINPPLVEKKLTSITSSFLKGKMHFYMGLFYDLYGDDINAKKQYLIVKNLQSPMFFEYRLNDWILAKMNG